MRSVKRRLRRNPRRLLTLWSRYFLQAATGDSVIVYPLYLLVYQFNTCMKCLQLSVILHNKAEASAVDKRRRKKREIVYRGGIIFSINHLGLLYQ